MAQAHVWLGARKLHNDAKDCEPSTLTVYNYFIAGATIAKTESTVTAKPETDSEKDACLNMPDLNAGLPVAPQKGYIKPFDFINFI